MPDIESLENYLDILFKDSNFDENHSLADDKKRHNLYKEVKLKLEKLSNKMQDILLEVNISAIDKLVEDFNKASKTPKEDIDSYIKQYAVEETLLENENNQQTKQPITDYIIELINNKGSNKNTKEVIFDVKNENISNANLSDKIASVIFYYDNLEVNLSDAKLGIIAKDKKMIKILRSMQVSKAYDQSMDLATNRIKPKQPITKRTNIHGKSDKEIS